jgi:ligand-binding sensor domain-containing protein/serine phosphatase RsbU (regulator of sigma subunit)
LAQAYVYAVSQSESGVLYASTGEGFCSFEGQKFDVYNTRQNLAENFATTHFTDSRGIIWIGHYQKGVSYIDGSRIQKIHQTLNLGTKVTSFAEDEQGFVWASTQGKGLLCIDRFFLPHEVKTEEKNINALLFDSDGQMLCATASGFFTFKVDGKTNEIEQLGTLPELEGKSVQCISQMKGCDRFWLAVQDEGLYLIEKNKKKYSVVSKISSELHLNAYNFSALYCDRNSDVWLSVFGEGLRRITYDTAKNEVPVIIRMDSRNGLPNEYIISIFQDYEGNTWFGSFGGGLIELPVERFSFFEQVNGLPDKNVRCILSDRQGRFWMGGDKGFFYFNIQSSLSGQESFSVPGLAGKPVTSAMQARDGKIWVGTEGYGIFKYDPESKKLEDFSKAHKINSPNINSIAETQKGTVIIGSTDGLYIFDPAQDHAQHYSTLDGLLHNNVTKVFPDSKGRVWLCSNGSLPYYIFNNEITVLNNIPELRSFNVTSIEEAEGNMWLCTEGDGVFCYNGKGFINYKIGDGLLSNYCYFVIRDQQNNIWLGHKNGLSYKPRYLKTFRTYTKKEGLLFSDFNKNSCFSSADGYLWFGTSNGLIRYRAGDLEKRSVEPKTLIYRLALNDKLFSPAESIEVPYSDYSLKIDYNSLSFTDPDKVNFKYRLLGLDTIWRYTTSRFMEFPKLNDGEYTFQLMAANSDNVWNSVPSQVSFVVKPPYWKRVWFYFMLVLVTTTLAYYAVRYRTSSLLIAKQELELKVSEKTALLQQEKETVEKIKQELEVRNKNFTDSVNYAQRIQTSILPSKKLIFEKFENAFVFYRPRDIVSGDFYWYSETEENFVIAAVDCTGHGVPGAFMSLVGSTLLNEIVNTKKITSPSAILTRLNRSIINVLKQESGSESAHDGMDMALCTISKSKDKLVFSGAQRPLYHFRDQVLTEIKGNPYFIGGYYENMNKVFVNSEISLKKGDMIYMFSDGYADQFGQYTHKKLTTKRFKELLKQVSDKPIKEQYTAIRNYFLQWKGVEEQVDDVLIIGIRF